MTTTERIVEAVKKAAHTRNYITGISIDSEALYDAIESVIGKERPKIDEMAEAMREFCLRVEKGELRSVKTYNKFKAILSDLTHKTDTTDGMV